MTINNDFYEYVINIWKQARLMPISNLSYRGTFAVLVFIPCQVAKFAGDAEGGSTVLPTKTMESILVGSWWEQGIARDFTRCMIEYKKDIYNDYNYDPSNGC